MSKVISYRESPENIAALDRLCESTERDRGYHLRRALENYLADNTWQLSAPNTGHGHVYPRQDGVVAKCGGPSFCEECKTDLAEKMAGDEDSDAL